MIIRTDWMPLGTVPARPGVYERESLRGPRYSRWDGTKWFLMRLSLRDAVLATSPSGFDPDELRWRGIVPEVHGCVPIASTGGCKGCAFDNPTGSVMPTGPCIEAIRKVGGNCGCDRIIWRPSSEVTGPR